MGRSGQRSQFRVFAFHFPPDISHETLSDWGFGMAGDALGSPPRMRAQPVSRAVNSRAHAMAFISRRPPRRLELSHVE
jgi:hypothetical protein